MPDLKKLIEEGLKQFHQSDEFRKLLEWLLTEHEKVILSGLRVKLKEEKYKGSYDNLTRVQQSYNIALDWVLSLLEE